MRLNKKKIYIYFRCVLNWLQFFFSFWQPSLTIAYYYLYYMNQKREYILQYTERNGQQLKHQIYCYVFTFF